MRRATLLLYALLVACHRGGASTAKDQDTAGEGGAPEQQPDEQAAMAAEHAMAGTVSNEDLHLRLTPLRPAAPGDSARAAQVLGVMRRELAKYRDVRVAEADGFRQFLPGTAGGGAAPVQHFTKLRWAIQARNGLDPARPTSLLYERAADGSLSLVGAMFTAPPQTSDAELDVRLPLSIVRWHEHINWCLPPLADARRRWRETKDGNRVFGPKSPIATAEACERWAAGSGRGCSDGWFT
jgi:hypothetical protein